MCGFGSWRLGILLHLAFTSGEEAPSTILSVAELLRVHSASAGQNAPHLSPDRKRSLINKNINVTIKKKYI